MIDDIVGQLYTEQPQKTLFHYASLSGLMGIVEHQKFWVTDIRYLNDAEELRHLGEWLNHEISKRLQESNGSNKVLSQFREWLRTRLNYGPMLFVGCFTENGNLLSQWRGYCPHGKGVSIGFSQNDIIEIVNRNAFMIGKCVYDKETKFALAEKIIDAVIAKSETDGESNNHHPSQSYHGTFFDVEPYLLKIAALVKHNSFHEGNCSRPALSRSSDAREGAALEGQADGVDGGDGSSSRGFDDRSNVGIELRAPLASKAVGYLSIDRAGA